MAQSFIRQLQLVQICSCFLLAISSSVYSSTNLEIVESGSQYRIIQIQVSLAEENTAKLGDKSNSLASATLTEQKSHPNHYQIWYATQPFDNLSNARMHSYVRIAETTGLPQPSIGSGYDDCWADSEPAHRDSLGIAVFEPTTRTWSCSLTGMLPETDYWFAVIAADSSGQPIRFDEPILTVPGRTDIGDQPPPAPDTQRVLLILCSILLFFMGLFAYLRWSDLRTGNLDSRWAHIYVAPAIIALAILSFYPVCYGIWLAFTGAHQSSLGEEEFIGLTNFITVFNTPGFLRVTLFTLIWSIANVSAHVGIGLLLAVVLTRAELKGKLFYRTLLLLPWAVPGYISILAWRGILQTNGLLNDILGTNLDLLAQVTSAQVLVILVNIWLGIPFMMMSMSGALMGIPRDMYEAAELEGVSKWKQFLHITLPNLKTTLVPLSLLGFIWSFNMFTVIYLITRGKPTVGFGEPGATDILITYVYDVAFQYGQYGVAAAWSVVIFLFLVAFSWLYMKHTRATESAA